MGYAFRSKQEEADFYTVINPTKSEHWYEFGKPLEDFPTCGTRHYKLKQAWKCAQGTDGVPRAIIDGEVARFTKDEYHLTTVLNKLRRKGHSIQECLKRIDQ